MAKRKTDGSTIQIEPPVYQEFSEWAERNHRFRKGVLTALTRFFMKQPTSFKMAVIDEELGDMGYAIADQLRRMADEIEANHPRPQYATTVLNQAKVSAESGLGVRGEKPRGAQRPAAPGVERKSEPRSSK